LHSTRFPYLKGELAIQHNIRDDDKKPTIIFLHDSLGCIQTWRNFPELLSKKSNCNYLVYDRIGYGASSKDEDMLKRDKGYLEKEANVLAEIIEGLKITNPILFGHSDGGSIALIAASKYGNQIEGIIVEAAHIFVEEVTLNGIRKMKDDFENGNLREKLAKYHGSKTDDVFWSWANTWLSDDFHDWNIEMLLPEITCPSLILQGKNDEYGTLKQVEGIKQGIQSKAKVIILENTGHSPHKENSEYVLQVASDFINQLNYITNQNG